MDQNPVQIKQNHQLQAPCKIIYFFYLNLYLFKIIDKSRYFIKVHPLKYKYAKMTLKKQRYVMVAYWKIIVPVITLTEQFCYTYNDCMV